jgi:hypothetical protein
MKTRNGFNGLRYGPAVGSCEDGKEYLGFIKGENFLISIVSFSFSRTTVVNEVSQIICQRNSRSIKLGSYETGRALIIFINFIFNQFSNVPSLLKLTSS